MLDNRTTLVEEILASDKSVKSFLAEEFKKILSSLFAEEIIRAHIHPLMTGERYPIVMEKIKEIAA